MIHCIFNVDICKTVLFVYFSSNKYGTCFGRIVCSFRGDIFAGDVVDIGTATNCTAAHEKTP